MEVIKKRKTVYSCQQTMDTVISDKREYVEFVARCLNDEEFVKDMYELLPFDNVAQAKLIIVDDTSPVRSLGLSIMRMDPEQPLFSLGISIEIAGGIKNKAVNSTIFIAACKTIENLREYVKTVEFSEQVRENFSKQIEDSFSGQVNN